MKEPGKDQELVQYTSAEVMPRDTCCSGSSQQPARSRELVLESSRVACLSAFVRASRYRVFRSREALVRAS